jgi:hypothetical protein
MSTPVEKERLNGEAARAADWKRGTLFGGAAMGDRSGGLFRDGRFLGATSPTYPRATESSRSRL